MTEKLRSLYSFPSQAYYRLPLSEFDNLPPRPKPSYPGLYSGLVPLHVLHHSCEGPIFGFEMIQELQRHGYSLSAGTMYPLLHGMERRGLLRSFERRQGARKRRFYRATPLGRRALADAKLRVRELFAELFEHE